MSLIDEVNESDARAYKILRKNYAHLLAIPDELCNLYRMLGDAYHPMMQTDAERTALNLLVGICQNQLIRGALAVYRLHSLMMFRETRAAVEAAGIAYLISTNNKYYRLLLDAPLNQDAGKEARNTFVSSTLFPKEHKIMRSLKASYNWASSRAHVSMITVVLSLRESDVKNKLHVTVQDVTGDARIAAEFPSLVHFICHAHLNILESSAITFPHYSSDAIGAFNKERVYIGQRLYRFRRIHKEQYPDYNTCEKR